jgi:hypothetical protein
VNASGILPPPNRPAAMPLPAPSARRGGTRSRSNQRLLHHALTESLYRSVKLQSEAPSSGFFALNTLRMSASGCDGPRGEE